MTEQAAPGTALAAISYPYSTVGSFFYVGAGGLDNGQIYQLASSDGKTWNSNVVGAGNGATGQTGTGMVALWQGTGGWPGGMPDSNNMNIFYVGAGGQIWNWFWDGDNGTWSNAPLSGLQFPVGNTPDNLEACTGTGLVAAWWPDNIRANVFYLGGDLQLWSWFWSGDKWESNPLWMASPGQLQGQQGLPAENGTPIAVAWEPSNVAASVFYVAGPDSEGNNAQIWTWWWDGNNWINTACYQLAGGVYGPLGQPARVDTAGRGLCTAGWQAGSQTGLFQNNRLDVFYVGADGNVWDWYCDIAGWANASLGSGKHVMENTELAVVWMPNGIDANVFYVGTDGQIWAWSLDGSTGNWTNFPLWEKSALGVLDKPGKAADGVAATWLGATEVGSTWEFQLNVFYSAESDYQMHSWYSWDNGIHWTNRRL